MIDFDVPEYARAVVEKANEIERIKQKYKSDLSEAEAMLLSVICDMLEKTEQGEAEKACTILYWRDVNANMLAQAYKHRFGKTYAKTLTANVRCKKCGNVSGVVIKSRTDWQNLKKYGFICEDCKRKENEQSEAQWKAKKEAEQKKITELCAMPYAEYLKTEHWKQVRTRALRKADYKCQLCSSGGNLNVHHRTYENRGNEDSSDLIVLCEGCHRKFHGDRR